MTRLTGVAWHKRWDNAVKERINDEVIAAKQVRKDHPEITWDQALKAAKETWDKVPLV